MRTGDTTRLSEEILASAATIAPSKDLVILTGTTGIATIAPKFMGSSGVLMLVPKDGNVGLLATDNIAAAVTMLQNRVTVLTYSRSQNKWYPGAIN